MEGSLRCLPQTQRNSNAKLSQIQRRPRPNIAASESAPRCNVPMFHVKHRDCERPPASRRSYAHLIPAVPAPDPSSPTLPPSRRRTPTSPLQPPPSTASSSPHAPLFRYVSSVRATAPPPARRPRSAMFHVKHRVPTPAGPFRVHSHSLDCPAPAVRAVRARSALPSAPPPPLRARRQRRAASFLACRTRLHARRELSHPSLSAHRRRVWWCKPVNLIRSPCPPAFLMPY